MSENCVEGLVFGRDRLRLAHLDLKRGDAALPGTAPSACKHSTIGGGLPVVDDDVAAAAAPFHAEECVPVSFTMLRQSGFSLAL